MRRPNFTQSPDLFRLFQAARCALTLFRRDLFFASERLELDQMTRTSPHIHDSAAFLKTRSTARVVKGNAIGLPRSPVAAVPFSVPPDVGTVAPRAPEAGMKGKASVIPKATILIVDDEPDVREVLEEYFVAHAYAALGAESAAAAKE